VLLTFIKIARLYRTPAPPADQQFERLLLEYPRFTQTFD